MRGANRISRHAVMEGLFRCSRIEHQRYRFSFVDSAEEVRLILEKRVW
jgi:hypothetical protein